MYFEPISFVFEQSFLNDSHGGKEKRVKAASQLSVTTELLHVHVQLLHLSVCAPWLCRATSSSSPLGLRRECGPCRRQTVWWTRSSPARIATNRARTNNYYSIFSSNEAVIFSFCSLIHGNFKKRLTVLCFSGAHWKKSRKTLWTRECLITCSLKYKNI